MGMARPHSQRGLSLVELMVAVTLGLVLIAGLIQVFLGNRQTQRLEQGVARVQEAGRLALDLLTRDLRAAGFHGCAVPLKGENSEQGVSPPMFTRKVTGMTHISGNFYENSVRGYERGANGGWTPTVPSDLTSKINGGRNGSDALALYFGWDTGARLNATASGSSSISIKRNNACIEANEVVMVANCVQTDMIRVTNTPGCAATTATLEHGATGNVDGNLEGSYDVDDMVLRFTERQYYVRDTGRRNPAGDPVFALFRRTNGSEEELVEGVEFMRILFGQKLNNGNIRFVSPSDASLDLSQVVSVRVALLVQSFDAARDVDDTNAYTLLDRVIDDSGTAITHGGGRNLRRVFTSTIELRNRLQL